MTGVLVAIAGSGTVIDQQTLVSASTGSAGSFIRGYVSGSQGTLTPGTSKVFGGASINSLYQDEAGGFVQLQIAGTLTNGGWNSITVDGNTPLLRSAATFSTSGGFTYWQWVSGLNGFAVGTRIVIWK